MTARRAMVALSALIGLPCGFAAGDVPQQADYAYAFPVRIEQPAEYLALEIPLELYRSVSDPTLRDLGVYNADGQAVPRMVKRIDERVQQVEHETPLGMVPLYGELEPSLERLRLLMQRNAAGTTLQFDSEMPDPVDPQLQLRAVIVDVGNHEEPFAALDFEWSARALGFIGRVIVEDGDDLADWRRLASGTLADLEFEGTRIERDQVELPRETGDFLRITWQDMPIDWRLESVTGIRRERGPDEEREWLSLAPIERSEDGREYVFDIGGHPPIDRVNLSLPGANVVIRASVEFRHGPETAWRRAHEGLFYKVSRGGNEIDSTPARLGPVRAGQWKVRIHSGRVDGEPRLQLGWRPERLLFLAQGEPPFTIAAGRAQDRVEQFPQHRLLGDSAIFSMLERSGEAGAASVGQRREAAGAMVMEGARTWTWRTVLVWIGLIAAVLFVGWLAWSLLREPE